MGFGTVYVQ